MLKIRREQNNALIEVVRDRFVERALEHFRKHRADMCRPVQDDELRDWIRRMRRRAENHEIKIERNVIRFLELAMAHGEGFDEESWAKKPLTESGVNETNRIVHVRAAAARRLAKGS